MWVLSKVTQAAQEQVHPAISSLQSLLVDPNHVCELGYSPLAQITEVCTPFIRRSFVSVLLTHSTNLHHVSTTSQIHTRLKVMYKTSAMSIM